MAGMGLSEYCQPINSLDVSRLIEQFTDLESRAPQLRKTIAAGNGVKEELLADQFAELSSVLFSAAVPAHIEAG
jgi:hypothetical protein